MLARNDTGVKLFAVRRIRDRVIGHNGWALDRIDSLESKTFVITGGNAGAGFEESRILMAKTAKVVMLNRNLEKLRAAVEKLKQEFGAEADVNFVRMDLADLSRVREAAGQILKPLQRSTP